MELDQMVKQIERERRPSGLPRLLHRAGLDTPGRTTLAFLPLLAAANGLLDYQFWQDVAAQPEHLKPAVEAITNPVNVASSSLLRTVAQTISTYLLLEWHHAHRYIKKSSSWIKRLARTVISPEGIAGIAAIAGSLYALEGKAGHVYHLMGIPEGARKELMPLIEQGMDLSKYTALSVAAMMGQAAHRAVSYFRVARLQDTFEGERADRLENADEKWKDILGPKKKPDNATFSTYISRSRLEEGFDRSLLLDRAAMSMADDAQKHARLMPYSPPQHFLLLKAMADVKKHPRAEHLQIELNHYLSLADPVLAERFHRELQDNPGVSIDTKIVAALRASATGQRYAEDMWKDIYGALAMTSKERFSSTERSVYSYASTEFSRRKLVIKEADAGWVINRYYVDAWIAGVTRKHPDRNLAQGEQPIAFFGIEGSPEPRYIEILLREKGANLLERFPEGITKTAYNIVMESFLSWRDVITETYEKENGINVIDPDGEFMEMRLGDRNSDLELLGRSIHGKRGDREPRSKFVHNTVKSGIVEDMEDMASQRPPSPRTVVTHNDLWPSNVLGLNTFIDGRYGLGDGISDCIHFSLYPGKNLSFGEKVGMLQGMVGIRELDRFEDRVRYWTWYHGLGLTGAHLARGDHGMAQQIFSTAKGFLKGYDYGDFMEYFHRVNAMLSW